MDWHLISFALALSLLTGIVFGLLPALKASRVDLNTVLKDGGGRWGTGLRQNKARAALVISEISLAMVLLVGSALLIRTFVALYGVDRGFRTANVITMQTSFSGPKYATSAAVAVASRDALERVRSLPGVVAASSTCCVPLQNELNAGFDIIGRPAGDKPNTGSGAWATVSAGYFDVFQIPLKRGRVFTGRDDATSPGVVVINTELRIGGTRFELIPVRGGETRDGLLIHLPDHQVMFAGDFIMPYLGAPFLPEGSLDGLLDTIDVVARKNPRHLLYGHEPLTRIFADPAVLVTLKSHLAWLRGEVLAAFQRGMERTAIQQANLIPPGLLSEDARAHVPYLVLRENVINRLYHQLSGYWQPDLEGVDYVSRADRGSMLVDYLGVSEEQLAKAVERMVADGKHELAASALEWTRNRFPESERLKHVESLTYLKLVEKYQNFNPFKVIVYSRKSGMRIPQMGPKGAER